MPKGKNSSTKRRTIYLKGYTHDRGHRNLFLIRGLTMSQSL